MSKYIDADALIMKLADYALASSPNENDDADIRMMDKAVYDAINECIKAVEEMPTLDVEPVRKWIPCSERLPEGYEDVIVCKDNGTVESGYYLKKSNMWMNANESAINVEFWMPLPEPPKMDGGSEE